MCNLLYEIHVQNFIQRRHMRLQIFYRVSILNFARVCAFLFAFVYKGQLVRLLTFKINIS
jgi:hypothetical protein